MLFVRSKVMKLEMEGKTSGYREKRDGKRVSLERMTVFTSCLFTDKAIRYTPFPQLPTQFLCIESLQAFSLNNLQFIIEGHSTRFLKPLDGVALSILRETRDSKHHQIKLHRQAAKS